MDEHPDEDTIWLDVPAALKYLNVLGSCVSALLERTQMGDTGGQENLIFSVELAVHEVCTNIIEHAYAGRYGRIRIMLALRDDPRRLLVDVCDNGRAFDLSSVDAPDFSEPQVRGYGLFLVRQLMDEVSYRTESGKNQWLLVKRL